MTDPKPVACSLGESDLQRRLDQVAEVGATSLIDRDAEGGKHKLRFRADPIARRRLEEIVAAEAECCPFLDLDLSERGGELILMFAAPDGGQSIADELAAAFVPSESASNSRAGGRSPSAGPRRCPRRS
jgi:MerR family copper efflux transcriptional regulator